MSTFGSDRLPHSAGTARTLRPLGRPLPTATMPDAMWPHGVFRIDTIRVGGGRPCAIRVTHVPTGTVISVDDQPTIKQNRDRAMSVLQEPLAASESDNFPDAPLRREVRHLPPLLARSPTLLLLMVLVLVLHRVLVRRSAWPPSARRRRDLTAERPSILRKETVPSGLDVCATALPLASASCPSVTRISCEPDSHIAPGPSLLERYWSTDRSSETGWCR